VAATEASATETTTAQATPASKTGTTAPWALMVAMISVAGVGIVALKKYEYRMK
jgi:hypothetical protein